MYSFHEIDPTHIHVGNPKLYDKTYVCKIKYQGKKLDLLFKNVRVINVKTPTQNDMYVQLKLDKSTIRHLVKFEKKIVNDVAEHSEQWFKNRVKSTAIDEFFGSAIILDDNLGAYFRCRLEEFCDDMLQFTSEDRVDFVMRASCVRFNKRVFNIGWNLVSWTKAQSNTFMFEDDDEETRVTVEDDNEDIQDDTHLEIEPDRDEIITIKNELLHDAKKISEQLSQELNALNTAIHHVEVSDVDIKYIDALHETLEKIVANYGKNQ